MMFQLKSLAFLVTAVATVSAAANGNGNSNAATTTDAPVAATLGLPCTNTLTGPPSDPSKQSIKSSSCNPGESCTLDYDDDGITLLPGTCVLEKCNGYADPDSLDYNADNEATVRVTICHRTCSATNPWVRITIDDDAWADLGNACEAGGHKREHNVTIDCKTKIQKSADDNGISFEEARTRIWGPNDADYLIKAHGTREAVRLNNDWPAVTVNNGGKATYGAAEKDYWGYWERACPYVRHGQCCGTEELGACCGGEPYVDASIELTKYSCTAGTTCDAAGVASDSCKDDLLSGAANAAAKYCYKVKNTSPMKLCSIDMSDPEWTGAGATVPGCMSAGETIYTKYEAGVTFPSSGSIIDEIATVSGTPASDNGDILPGALPVTASDPSRLQGEAGTAPTPAATPDTPAVTPNPGINIEKTSVVGSASGAFCNPGSEMVAGTVGMDVHLCYDVTNTGNTYLSNVKVTDGCNGPMNGDCGLLPPGGNCRIPYNLGIPAGGQSVTCPGNVVGTPSDGDGTALGLPNQTDSDPSGLQETDMDTECTVSTMSEAMSGGGMKYTTTETCVTCNCE
jgi:hypothetical protein